METILKSKKRTQPNTALTAAIHCRFKKETMDKLQRITAVTGLSVSATITQLLESVMPLVSFVEVMEPRYVVSINLPDPKPEVRP